MIRTGPVASWTSPEALGPVYPFVGWEGAMVVACLALWLGWVFWQWRAEQADYEAELANQPERSAESERSSED